MTVLSAIEVELLRNGLTSICDEMYVALMRSAYSTNIKARKDHSTAIFDIQGRVVVQGESLPLHLASMLGLVEVVLERVGPSNLNPGDMFISNDRSLAAAHICQMLRSSRQSSTTMSSFTSLPISHTMPTSVGWRRAVWPAV